MSSPGDRPYRVECAALVAASIRALFQRASQRDKGESFVTALMQIQERLQSNPHEFGEPLKSLAELQLEIRVAAINPLVVNYGAHDDQRDVVLQGVHLLPF